MCSMRIYPILSLLLLLLLLLLGGNIRLCRLDRHVPAGAAANFLLHITPTSRMRDLSKFESIPNSIVSRDLTQEYTGS